MKYASVNGERREAEPKLLGGTCPNCEREVIAKCGQQRIWHWSHKGKLECDHWWEPETEWHRDWKSKFPREWQEVIHKAAESGERHIADVRNEKGWVLEFQHSSISPEERLSRENFYKPMVWVADGKSYKRDLAAFSDALEYGTIINDKPLTVSSPRMSKAAIFKRWAPIKWPVFIDFGDEEFVIGRMRFPDSVLWQLQLHPRTGEVVAAAATRESFLQCFGPEGGELKYFHVTRPPPPPSRRGRYRSRRF